ncbi:MAG TPA: hypothetical protein VGM92_02815 [Candidatus Kapabacteria bacterium]|jgi:hypothetical protein
MFTAFVVFIMVSLSAELARPQVAQAQHGVGVPRARADSIQFRFYSGMGINAGHPDAPNMNEMSIAYEAHPVLYLFNMRSSSGSPKDAIQPSLTEFDLMIGYDWRERIPLLHGPPIRLYFSFAMGVSVETYVRPVSSIVPVGLGTTFTTTTSKKDITPGFPVQFTAVYEPMPYLGIGPMLFFNSNGSDESYGGALVIEGRF